MFYWKEPSCLYVAPVNGFCNNHIIESHECFEIKQDVIKAFNSYCREKGFVPVSERKFIEQFKKIVFVRESRLTLFTKEHREGERFRVWRGVELIGDVSKTQFSTKRDNSIPPNPDVQGPQTQLEKTGKYTKSTDPGLLGQCGHESGDEG